MAMSFSRPDPSEPASVADASFSTGRRGFDQAEVRDFLRMVAAELGRLQERERFLERELRSAQASPDLTSAALSEDDLTRLLGEETARVIATARESAVEIKAKAEQAAARMVSEASDEANRLREEADLEASRRRADANSDAEAEIAMAKQQGRDMVNEARSYRERVLSELARRRELAREQIEQLLHGRDRLMQSFERARLVAVDVVAELQPLGEPDEYVNLSPTTGPVPVMVPNAKDHENDDGPAGSFAEFDRAAEADDLPETESEAEDAATQADPADEATDADAEPDIDDAQGATGIEGDEEEPADDDEAGSDVDSHVEDAPEATADGEEINDVDTDETPDTAVDGAGEAGEAGEAEPSNSDDVVVDLFARLRAGTEAEAAAEPEDDPAEDTSTESVAIGEAPDADPVIADPDVDDSEPSVFEQREEDLTPLIVAGAKKLKRVLADEQNDLLDVLRRDDSVSALDDLLPAVSEHVARYADAVADDLVAAAQAGAASAGATRKLRAATSKLAGTQARAVLQEHLVAPLRDRLERVIADASGDNDEITRSSRAIYREWKTQHIDEQLDDVFRAAYGRGRLAGFPEGSHVVWTVDPSAPSCPDCDDNVLGGAVVAGSEFPTGDIFAPAHPGCRCLLTAVER